jgi:ketosteroid isomerase-like protein
VTSRTVALAIVLSLCACNFDSRKNAAASKIDVKHVIDSLNSRFMKGMTAGQVDSVADIFAQDVWQMPPNQMPLVGRDSLRAFWKRAVETGSWQFDIKTDDVISTDSLAVERGHYTLKGIAGPKATYPSFEDRGNYLALWRHESDGHWRVVWDAPVSTIPMPTPPTPQTPATRKTPAGGG